MPAVARHGLAVIAYLHVVVPLTILVSQLVTPPARCTRRARPCQTFIGATDSAVQSSRQPSRLVGGTARRRRRHGSRHPLKLRGRLRWGGRHHQAVGRHAGSASRGTGEVGVDIRLPCCIVGWQLPLRIPVWLRRNLRVAGLRHAVVDGCTSRRVTLLTLHLLLLLLLEQHGHRLLLVRVAAASSTEVRGDRARGLRQRRAPAHHPHHSLIPTSAGVGQQTAAGR
mmetsp:Transcript_19579/g.59231  ORF Transcript_19579/g.59231 Transcript_19579/m.59231 type:complete len:225 (-) Transcript_19579:629-1303(-)